MQHSTFHPYQRPHRAIFCWLWLSTALLLPACQKDNAPLLPDANPRILAMQISGIAEDQIKIDQNKNTITVTLPASFTSEDVKNVPLRFQLTDDAKVVRELGGNAAENYTTLNLCDCNSSAHKIKAVDRTGGPSSSSTEYTLSLKPADSLKVEPLNLTGFVLGKDTWFDVQAANYYDGVPAVEVALIPVQGATTERYLIQTGCGNQRIECTRANQLQVWPDPARPIKPGSYLVEVSKANGRKTVSSRPLLVAKGTAQLDYYTVAQRGVPGETVSLNGANLFLEDNLQILLTAPNGTQTNLQPTGANPFGTTLDFRSDPAMKPGSYGLQILKNGQAITDCYRFSLTGNGRQPYLISVGKTVNPTKNPVSSFCPLNVPLVLTRGSTDVVIAFGTPPTNAVSSAPSATLVSTENAQLVVPLPLSLPDLYFGPGTFQRMEATLKPDATTPPGKYRLVVLLTDKFTHQVEASEPFEQIVEVR